MLRVFNEASTEKTAIQCHYNGVNHFVTSSFRKDANAVRIYDILAMDLSGPLKHRPWLLYRQGKPSLEYQVVYDQQNGVS